MFVLGRCFSHPSSCLPCALGSSLDYSWCWDPNHLWFLLWLPSYQNKNATWENNVNLAQAIWHLSPSQPLPGEHTPLEISVQRGSSAWPCAGEWQETPLAVPGAPSQCATRSWEHDTSQLLPGLLFLDPLSRHAASLIFRLYSSLKSYQIFNGLLLVGVTHRSFNIFLIWSRLFNIILLLQSTLQILRI